MLKIVVKILITIITYTFLHNMTAHALCVDRASLLFECSVEKNDKIIQICGDIERKIYYRFGKNISQPELKMTRSFGDYQLYSGNNEVGRNFDYKLQLKMEHIFII